MTTQVAYPPLPHVKEVLTYAYKLIEKDGGWTIGCAARDKDGKETGASREEAVAFCVLGAIERACFDLAGDRHFDANLAPKCFDLLREVIGTTSKAPRRLIEWNDTAKDKQVVLDGLRQAIKVAA